MSNNNVVGTIVGGAVAIGTIRALKGAYRTSNRKKKKSKRKTTRRSDVRLF